MNAAMARAGANAEHEQSAWFERQVARAELRAPFSGRVLSARLIGAAGKGFDAGDTVCVVGDFSAVRARALVTELDLDDVRVGAPVRLKLRAEPGRELRGTITAIEPVAVLRDGQRDHRVWIALRDMPLMPREGLIGRAWVRSPAHTPAVHFVRMLARFVRADLWV
jgi:hypothetical protein